MDRKSYKLPFRKTGITKFQCPSCGKGLLKIKKDTFHYSETKGSSSCHSHEAWEPEWIEYVYSCLLECSNTNCKDTVASSGTGSVTQYMYHDHEGVPDVGYDDYFQPEFFSPHLKIFHSPKGIPEEVENEINKSFSLLFSDPSSAANHIRVALEHLLTHLKIKRYFNNNGRRSFLSLHKRIALLPNKYDHIKDLFFAVKWLGNAGSHSNHKVTLDDVLDSYELMDEMLVEIFYNRRAKAKALAKKINKKKGP